jgi:Flp pilus assembly protein TadD
VSQNALARRYYVRGCGELGRGDAESACESFRAANDLAPSFLSARLGFASALARLGDAPRAAQVLRAGIGRTPADAPVRARCALWRSLGDVLVAGGDYLGAVEAYREASVIDASERTVDEGLARVYAKLGRWKDSFTHLARASAPAGTAAP